MPFLDAYFEPRSKRLLRLRHRRFAHRRFVLSGNCYRNSHIFAVQAKQIQTIWAVKLAVPERHPLGFWARFAGAFHSF